MTDVALNIKGLEHLAKALKDHRVTIRIGILGGGKNARNNGAMTNAEIGAQHEFGTSKLPQRSFLRIPISENLEKRIDASGALDADVLRQVVTQGSVVPWMKKIAAIAEGIVADAFDTGGFGKWKPSNMKYKKNHQTLVETTQLRNSITSEVVENG